MSDVTYDAGSLTVTLNGAQDVADALGDLAGKTPAAVKTALNATAREARKRMIEAAGERYAVNEVGRRRLKDLKQTQKATNRQLSAKIGIASLRRDLGYFTTALPYPNHFTGTAWRKGPDVWTGKALKESPMTPFPGNGNRSKAFLMQFKSGHVGFVQRVLGSSSENTRTENGRRRWRNAAGKVEKIETRGAPSEATMHGTVWPEEEPGIEEYLRERLSAQVERVLARAEARAKAGK